MNNITIIPIKNLPEFSPKHDLIDELIKGFENNNIALEDNDVIVVTQKIVSKVENRLTKANLNSMKTKFLTGKKKISSIQPECGVEQDFMLIMKNNLQRADISNPSPTAGKYLVYTRGKNC